MVVKIELQGGPEGIIVRLCLEIFEFLIGLINILQLQGTLSPRPEAWIQKRQTLVVVMIPPVCV